MISIPKNAREVVKVRLREFSGEHYLDVRTFVEGDDGVTRPTKKGVAVRLDLADHLADAIREVSRQERVDDE
jgi:hypothetical protein